MRGNCHTYAWPKLLDEGQVVAVLPTLHGKERRVGALRRFAGRWLFMGSIAVMQFSRWLHSGRWDHVVTARTLRGPWTEFSPESRREMPFWGAWYFRGYVRPLGGRYLERYGRRVEEAADYDVLTPHAG